jgi:hypothetical protein
VSKTTRQINAGADRVFAVLADGWTYSDWVVGTAHIRDVDPDWPQPGAEIHHKAGPWPVSLRDHTTSIECQPDRMLLLNVRLWPLGAGTVRIVLDRLGPNETRVTMEETFTEGPLIGLRNKVNDVLLHYRNRESLRRLADLARGRPTVPAPAAAPAEARPDADGAQR